jgi:vanillate O-demethylase ferredoxin subunit
LWIDLAVERRTQIAPGVALFKLVGLTKQPLPAFTAGAYIDVQIPGGMLRPYSLCNAPHDTSQYCIAVRKECSSRGASAYLHDKLRAGDYLRVRHPQNEFPLNPVASYSALFAGGIGVAPLISMAESLWHRGAAFELHLSARNAQQAPFASYLQASPYRHQVGLHWSERCDGRVGFDACIRQLPPLAHIYLCGPAGFMEAAIASAVRLGWPIERLHFERFT